MPRYLYVGLVAASLAACSSDNETSTARTAGNGKADNGRADAGEAVDCDAPFEPTSCDDLGLPEFVFNIGTETRYASLTEEARADERVESLARSRKMGLSELFEDGSEVVLLDYDTLTYAFMSSDREGAVLNDVNDPVGRIEDGRIINEDPEDTSLPASIDDIIVGTTRTYTAGEELSQQDAPAVEKLTSDLDISLEQLRAMSTDRVLRVTRFDSRVLACSDAPMFLESALVTYDPAGGETGVVINEEEIIARLEGGTFDCSATTAQYGPEE